MTRVFIGGSRHLSRLNADVQLRINTMISRGFAILIGDANGADKAVQRYLTEKSYRNVTVYCMASACRNNVGSWPTRSVAPPPGARGFSYYAAKDRAMAEDATHGLMLWDGESKGTLNNVINLARQEKPVVVFFAPAKAFCTIRTPDDVIDLVERCDTASMQRLDRELGIRSVLKTHWPASGEVTQR
jgi:hypothetical protein